MKKAMLVISTLLCALSNTALAESRSYHVGDWIGAEQGDGILLMRFYSLCRGSGSIIVDQLIGNRQSVTTLQYELTVGDTLAPFCTSDKPAALPPKCPSMKLIDLKDCVATFE